MSQHSWAVSVVVWVERLCPFLVGGVMLLVGLLGGGPTLAGAQDPVDLNLAGYELFPGIDCTRNGGQATCGVTFGGWTGGDGAIPGGWSPYPGDHHGFWEVTLDRQGTAGFDSTVTVLEGIFTLAVKKGKKFVLLSGSLSGGQVQWPKQGQSLGCGTDVAGVTVDLQITDLEGAPATFQGCLHDLPAGTIIPPPIWGTLTIP